MAGQDSILAWQASAITGEAALVGSEPLESWKALLAYHAIETRADVLLRVLNNSEEYKDESDKKRPAIEWYLKVAAFTKDVSAKATAYQFIGNVAWSKLDSHTLSTVESAACQSR